MPAIRPNCLLRLLGRPVSTFHPPTFQLVLRNRKRTFRVHHLPHPSACSRSGASHILRHFPDCQMMLQHVVHLTLVDSFGRYITSPHEICYFFWAFFLTNSGKNVYRHFEKMETYHLFRNRVFSIIWDRLYHPVCCFLN